MIPTFKKGLKPNIRLYIFIRSSVKKGNLCLLERSKHYTFSFSFLFFFSSELFSFPSPLFLSVKSACLPDFSPLCLSFSSDFLSDFLSFLSESVSFLSEFFSFLSDFVSFFLSVWSFVFVSLTPSFLFDRLSECETLGFSCQIERQTRLVKTSFKIGVSCLLYISTSVWVLPLHNFADPFCYMQ